MKKKGEIELKIKIIGFLICMLLTSIPILTATNTMNNQTQQTTTQYPITNGWYEQDKITASDGANADLFGSAVSIDGEYAIVGAQEDDDSGSESGSAYIYIRSGNTWTQQAKLLASDGTINDLFGSAVSLDGEYAIIGAYGNDDSGVESGSAYIFKRDGTVWTQQAKLLAADGDAGDYFGFSVSIDGDYAIIGAPHENSYKGSAYIFKRSGSSWIEESKLIVSDSGSFAQLGTSVYIDGEYVIIGAPSDKNGDGDYTGAAHIFKRTDTTWTYQAKLLASDGEADERFGNSVSMDGDYAIIGAFFDDDNGMYSGSAYVFKRTDTTWAQQAKLLASDGDSEDRFGNAVSIDGVYAIVGAERDEVLKGAMYAFKRSGTSWVEEEKLIGTDTVTGDLFGRSVSIDGGYALVGAPGHYFAIGAAYIFKKPIPDLDAIGSLSWTDIPPGGTVTGSFLIANIGEPDSELNWEIIENPEWGTWTFVPPSGTGLTPDMGSITIGVEVIAPDEKNKDFSGDIKIVNLDDAEDYETITVSLSTPKNIPYTQIPFLLRLIEKHPLIFQLLQRLFNL